jgi:hypothetical protein
MIGRVVDQIFRSSTAAPGEPARSSDSVFDRMRGFTPEPRDFTSHFHQSLANVPDFPEQATFVILFHSYSSSYSRSLSCRSGQTTAAFANLFSF